MGPLYVCIPHSTSEYDETCTSKCRGRSPMLFDSTHTYSNSPFVRVHCLWNTVPGQNSDIQPFPSSYHNLPYVSTTASSPAATTQHRTPGREIRYVSLPSGTPSASAGRREHTARLTVPDTDVTPPPHHRRPRQRHSQRGWPSPLSLTPPGSDVSSVVPLPCVKARGESTARTYS